jgi:hypothetical protein
MASASRAKASARSRTQRDRTALRERLLEGRLRFFAEHEHLTAALCFALLIFVYLWPALLGLKILSPISMLYEVPPWQHLRPPDLSGYQNGLLSDVPFADYPWRFFARELIREGTLPAWNPHVFAGIPFFNNPQTGIFSAFSLPLWILPQNYGVGVEAALKLWFSAFGTYLLVRELRLGLLPGLLAGTSFAFCSLNIVWLTHGTLPAVAAMLPWMLWLIERVYTRGRLSNVLWLAVVTAVGLGGGHPGMQLHIMAAAGVYAVLRAAIRRDPEAEAFVDPLRPLGLAVGGLALGALLMGVMLVPELFASHGTLGTVARQGGRGTIPGAQMPFTTSRTILFPDWWGRPSALSASHAPQMHIIREGHEVDYAVEVNYNERTFYAGVVAVLLAGVALVARGGWRRKAPFAILGGLAILVTLHVPGFYDVVEALPGFNLVQNQRLHFVFELCVAVLAAFGLQGVLDRPAGDRRRFGLLAGAAVLGLVMVATVGPSATDLGRLVRHFATGKDFQSDHVLELTTVAWFLLFVAGVGATVWAVRRWPAWKFAAAAAVVLLAAIDMLHFAHGYQPMGPESRVIPPRTAAVAFLQEHRREGRIGGITYVMPQDWNLVYGLNDVRGYDPPQPTLRMYHLWQQGTQGQLDWAPFGFESLSPQALRIMSVLGARYVVAPAGTKLPPAGHDSVVGALRLAYAGEDMTIYRNAAAMPRALVAPRVVVTGTEDQTASLLAEERFDPRRAVVVEADQPGAAALAGAHGTARVVRDHNAQVTLEAVLDRPGLVVLNDDFTDGWSVQVDGRQARALHVNDVMRGVVVPAGRHTVVWSYAIPGFGAGAALTLVGLIVLLGGAVALRLRRRRAAAPGR